MSNYFLRSNNHTGQRLRKWAAQSKRVVFLLLWVFLYLTGLMVPAQAVGIAQAKQVLDISGLTSLQLSPAGIGPFVFTSSDTNVCNVDASGLVSLMGLGSAQITITDNGDASSAQASMIVIDSARSRAVSASAVVAGVGGLLTHYTPISDYASLTQAIANINQSIERHANAFYQLFYTTPARGGYHKLTLEVIGNTNLNYTASA